MLFFLCRFHRIVFRQRIQTLFSPIMRSSCSSKIGPWPKPPSWWFQCLLWGMLTYESYISTNPLYCRIITCCLVDFDVHVFCVFFCTSNLMFLDVLPSLWFMSFWLPSLETAGFSWLPCSSQARVLSHASRLNREAVMNRKLNWGTPKWIVYNGKSYYNRWFGGTPISGNLDIGLYKLELWL